MRYFISLYLIGLTALTFPSNALCADLGSSPMINHSKALGGGSGASESIGVNIHVTIEMVTDGNSQVSESCYKFTSNGGRFLFQSDGESKDCYNDDIIVVSDGKSIFIGSSVLSQYILSDATGGISDFIRMSECESIGNPMGALGLSFLASGMQVQLDGRLVFTELIDSLEEGGKTRHKYRSLIKGGPRFTSWYEEKGDSLLVDKIYLELGEFMFTDKRDKENALDEYNITFRYSDWTIGKKVDESLFTIPKPKKEWEKVDRLSGELDIVKNKSGEVMNKKIEIDPIKKVDVKIERALPTSMVAGSVGSIPTTLILRDSNGGTIDIEDIIGNKVIVLDFWATWCGPCVAAMPKIEAAVDRFPEDAVLFAVNLRDSRNTINSFLSRKQLNISVLMDSTGSTAATYNIKSLPTTLIIGLDGLIRNKYVGYNSNIESILTREIAAALEK